MHDQNVLDANTYINGAQHRHTNTVNFSCCTKLTYLPHHTFIEVIEFIWHLFDLLIDGL